MRAVLFLTVVSCLLFSLPERTTAQSFPIRRSVPLKPGDRWRAEITSVKTSTGRISVGIKDERVSEKETTRLIATVSIDDTDAQGYAVAWKAEIVRFTGPQEGSSSKTLLPRGAVVLFDRRDGELAVVDENGQPLEDAPARIAEFLTLPTRQDDAPFEPKDEIAIGKAWMADTESMRESIIDSGPPQLKQYPEVLGLRATGRLTANRKEQRQDCLEFELRTVTRITQAIENEQQVIEKADQDLQETTIIPANYSTDFLERRTVLTDVLLTKSRKPGVPALNVTQTTTTTEKRTYFEFRGGGIRPWTAPARPDSLLRDLLFGFDFEPPRMLDAEGTVRIRPYGRIEEPAIVRSAAGLVAGQVGQALDFNGSSNHVNVLEAPEMLRSGVEAVTIACWMKSPPKKLQMLFDVGFYGSESMTLLRQENVATFHMGPETGGVGLEFPLTGDEWTHIAVTWDGESQHAWVDGQLVAEVRTTRKGTLNEKSIGRKLVCTLGTQAKTDRRSERCLLGQLDEFALWTRALDASEIAAVFEKGRDGQSLFGN